MSMTEEITIGLLILLLGLNIKNQVDFINFKKEFEAHIKLYGGARK